jgi:hypothetical protein
MDGSARFYMVTTAVDQIIANRWSVRPCLYLTAVMAARPFGRITIFANVWKN